MDLTLRKSGRKPVFQWPSTRMIVGAVDSTASVILRPSLVKI